MAAHIGDDGVKIYILDCFRRKASFPQQIQLVRQGFESVKPDLVILESNGYQAALGQQLLDITVMPIAQSVSKLNKEVRLDSITPAMQAGNVLFSPRLNPDTSVRVEERGDLIGEMLDFPFSENDDMVDAFSQGGRYIQEYALAIAARQNSDDYFGDGEAYIIDIEEDLDEIAFDQNDILEGDRAGAAYALDA